MAFHREPRAILSVPLGYIDCTLRFIDDTYQQAQVKGCDLAVTKPLGLGDPPPAIRFVRGVSPSELYLRKLIHLSSPDQRILLLLEGSLSLGSPYSVRRVVDGL